MPMPIQTSEEYEKVINVSWYHPGKTHEEQVYVWYSLSHYSFLWLIFNSVSHAFFPSLECIRCAALISGIF